MAHNFKKQGVKGRTSKTEIATRISLCRDLYVNNPLLSEEDFKFKFSELLRANHLKVPSSPKTYANIFKDAHITFNNNTVELDDDILITTLRECIQLKISQLRVTCKSFETILFDEYNVSDDDLDFDSFLSRNIFLSKLNYFQEKKSEKKIGSHTLTTIYLILNTVGFENYIADIFEKSIKNNNECLYIETHRYCVKIILEYKDLSIVAEKMYKLLSLLQYDKSKT